MKYELCEYLPVKVIGYGWTAIEEFDTEEEANTAKQSKVKPANFMVREKREPLEKSSIRHGRGLSATKRRELFNSSDPKEFKQIM